MATIRGSQTKDTLRGRDGDDQIFGLAGGDTLFGGAGVDRIDGGGGPDVIYGGPGNDRINGGDGNDELRGQGGADLLIGGNGNDRLFGGADADVLTGGRGDDRLTGGPGVDTLTGGLGADRFVFSAADQGKDQITDFNPAEGDTLSLTGALAGASVRMVDDGTNTTVRVHTADADSYTNLAVLQGHREPIDVWYGDHQHFGDPGEGQRWVNILGTVATKGLDSLTYTLNNGPEHDLSVGADTRRLVSEGDFNLELDYQQLKPGSSDDVVHIRATYGNGDVFTRDVTIDYDDGHAWPKAYKIDWAQVTDLQDAVQVVDGLWSFDADGARPAAQGYDRVLAIGDAAWDNYRVELSIEMHDLHTVDPRGRDGGGILLGLQWNGHTSVPVGGDVSPHEGWIPSGAFQFGGNQVDRITSVELRPTEWYPQLNGNKNTVVQEPLQLLEDHTYNFKYETQRLAADTNPNDGIDRVYSLKVWEQGTPEPNQPVIHQIMVEQAPRGGIYLNAHYFDVTFGDVAVKSLPPSNEVLPGQDNLAALLASGPEPGAAATGTAGPASVAFEASAVPQLAQLVGSPDDPAPAS